LFTVCALAFTVLGVLWGFDGLARGVQW